VTAATHCAAGAAICRYVRWKPAGLVLAALSHFALDAIPHFEDPRLLAAVIGPVGQRLWPVLNAVPWATAAGLGVAIWLRHGPRAGGSRGQALYLIAGGLLGIALDPVMSAMGPESFMGRINHAAHVWKPAYGVLRDRTDLWPALVVVPILLEVATFAAATWLLLRRGPAGPPEQEASDMAREVTVRGAATHDLEAVADLWAELIEVHRQLDQRLWEPAPDGREKYREWIAETLARDDRALFVADADGPVVGFTHVVLDTGPQPMRPRVSAKITDMVVAADYRRHGIGRLLAEAAREWSVGQGAEDLRLSAAVRNPAAVAFWEAMGFEPWLVGMYRKL